MGSCYYSPGVQCQDAYGAQHSDWHARCRMFNSARAWRLRMLHTCDGGFSQWLVVPRPKCLHQCVYVGYTLARSTVSHMACTCHCTTCRCRCHVVSVQRTTLAVLRPIWPVLVQGLTDSSTKHVADQLFQRNLIKVDEYEKIISSNVSSSYDRARILLGIAKHFPFEGCIEFAQRNKGWKSSCRENTGASR